MLTLDDATRKLLKELLAPLVHLERLLMLGK